MIGIRPSRIHQIMLGRRAIAWVSLFRPSRRFPLTCVILRRESCQHHGHLRIVRDDSRNSNYFVEFILGTVNVSLIRGNEAKKAVARGHGMNDIAKSHPTHYDKSHDEMRNSPL